MIPDWKAPDAAVENAFAILGISDRVDLSYKSDGSFNRIFRYKGTDNRFYILRIRPEWLTERRISFEHTFSEYLSENGLPTLAPIPLHKDRTWLRVDGFFCESFPFVEGRHGRPEISDVYLAGRLLGHFQNCARKFDCEKYEAPEVQNQFEPHELQPKLESLREVGHSTLLDEMFDRLWSNWEKMRECYPNGLPELLRHGDFHLWNLLFSKDDPSRIVLLLDLDMAAYGPRVYDVSYWIYFLRHALIGYHGKEGGNIGRWRDIYESFLRGYTEASEEVVARVEFAAVPYHIQCIAINFLLEDIARTHEISEAAKIYESEYLSIIRWLETYRNDLRDILAKFIRVR